MSHMPPAAMPSNARTTGAGFDLEHEWRTPMTVIQSAAEVLRAYDLTDEERELFLDALLAEATRLRACLELVLTGGHPRPLQVVS